MDEYCKPEKEQGHIKTARAVIDSWSRQTLSDRQEKRDKIEAKVRSLEERIVFGGMDSDITSMLSELDHWRTE